MTQAELIQKCRAGKTLIVEHSFHRGSVGGEFESKRTCNHRHGWRTIVCDGGDLDVVECPDCGAQKVARCNFDEDFA